MKKIKGLRVMLLLFFATLAVISGQADAEPQLGAQIWIEPGQTPAEIDSWFKDLEVAKMPVARLFIMWTYLETAPGQWDFTLYDTAFRSAEKHHVHIVATLTPNGPPTFRKGDGNQGRDLIKTERDRALSAIYLQKVIERYHSSPALDTWLLVNEPGQLPVRTDNAVRDYRIWLSEQYRSIKALNATWGGSYEHFDTIEPAITERTWNHNPELDWRTFFESYQTGELKRLAEQVRALDPAHPLHLNPAGISGNIADASDDLPKWRGFLDTLGCSIHPAWHFALFDRDRYALGVSYTNDLVRGSIEPKPYWVTELQGGNNIYSGGVPMEPTASDIAQWVWTSVGAGADRVIFWLLNARREGVEAGEWSLLDFQQQPSKRLNAASEIAQVMHQHAAFFDHAKPEPSPVTILLSLETSTFEETYHKSDDPARDKNAHTLEMFGFYETLSKLGPPPNIKYMDDYDWAAVTASPRVAILPDVRELTEAQTHALQVFAEHGNILLISGLTGFYGPHAKAWPLAGFPLGDVTGSTLKEVHLREVSPTIDLDGASSGLPSRFWVSSLNAVGAKAIGRQDGDVIATERTLPSGGRVIYIPSPIGLGAWLTDAQPLADYLRSYVLAKIKVSGFSFEQPASGCLLRTLKLEKELVTVVTNEKGIKNHCVMHAPLGLQAENLWGSLPILTRDAAVFDLEPRATSVQLWR